jgi:OOP family OmpA-OmpF porin
MEIIDQLVEVFKANGNDRYLIEGHTDVSGDTTHNQALSERRAKAVVRYLVERHGLPESRFNVRGQGSANLLLPTDPRNARNRRVAIMAVDG